MPELTPMRDGEALDLARLATYLRSTMEDLPSGPIEAQQFAAGRSNLTYLITVGSTRLVLRRPPLGPLAARAHDMAREFRWLEAIHSKFPWAPKPLALCLEPGVLGSIFFLMEHRHGVGLEEFLATENASIPAFGDHISRITMSRLADLHAVDWSSLAIRSQVKPDGFLARQVAGWIERYQRAKTAEIPGEHALTQWLRDHVPPSPDPTILHYDYKLNNMVFEPDCRDVAGIFDWEMTTVGDPIADVAVAMSYWVQSDDDPRLRWGLNESVTIRPGFWSRDQWVTEYARRTGRDLSNFPYYLTFAYFKLAVIVAQIYYRYYCGQTNDPRFAHMNQMVEHLIRHAWEMHPASL